MQSLFMYGKNVSLYQFYFTAAVFQAKNDPFKKEGSKKDAEDRASSIKSSDKRSSTANKWVTEKTEKLLLCCLKAHLSFGSLFYFKSTAILQKRR